jgi:alanine racemase
MAVLKADAYGLGAVPIAERLASAGADGFCTATLEEAIALRRFGKPVQILGALLDFELEEAVRNGFILGITCIETAQKISRESVRQGVTTEVHFKIDTGMGRLGILSSEAISVIRETVKLPNLNCCGIYSHFPAAGDDPLSRDQADQLRNIISSLEKEGIPLTKKHIANSDAVIMSPFALKEPFTWIRTGINLHGGFSPGAEQIGLNPVFTLKTRVVQVREMPAGHTIGYNRTCRLSEPAEIATIAAGYADGLPLHLSNRGFVVIRGKRCPIAGRISMDYTTVRLDGFAPGEIQSGEPVILLGGSGSGKVPVEEWAELKGTHPYEILCSIGPRVKRNYIK